MGGGSAPPGPSRRNPGNEAGIGSKTKESASGRAAGRAGGGRSRVQVVGVGEGQLGSRPPAAACYHNRRRMLVCV